MRYVKQRGISIDRSRGGSPEASNPVSRGHSNMRREYSSMLTGPHGGYVNDLTSNCLVGESLSHAPKEWRQAREKSPAWHAGSDIDKMPGSSTLAGFSR